MAKLDAEPLPSLRLLGETLVLVVVEARCIDGSEDEFVGSIILFEGLLRVLLVLLWFWERKKQR